MKLDVASYRRRGARVLRCAVVVFAVWCGRAEPLGAAERAPFSEFASMLRGDLDSLQVKFTYVGPRFMSIPTIMITAHGHHLEPSLFKPFYRSGLPYGMEFHNPIAVSVSTAVLEAFIDSLSAQPEVTDGGMDAAKSWSFAMGNYVNGVPKVFESVLSNANTILVFEKLRQAAAVDPRAAQEIGRLACDYYLRNDSPLPDVTGSVTLTFAGARPDVCHHGHFMDRLRVRNTSKQDIHGPIYLILIPRGDVKLARVDGRSCFNGGPQYLNALGAGTLRPSQSVDVRVELTNPRREPVTYHYYQVFAGPGVP